MWKKKEIKAPETLKLKFLKEAIQANKGLNIRVGHAAFISDVGIWDLGYELFRISVYWKGQIAGQIYSNSSW